MIIREQTVVRFNQKGDLFMVLLAFLIGAGWVYLSLSVFTILCTLKTNNQFQNLVISRPPSVMTTSFSSTTSASNVPLRPRSITRKSRPASVHVTGVSAAENSLLKRSESKERQKSTTIKEVTKKPDTNTIKRNVKKNQVNDYVKIENFESIESAFASGSEYSKTPEPEINNKKVSEDLLDFTPEKETPTKPEESTADSERKLLTESEAKAAIAEKRRLAREAAEKEAARIAQEQAEEEERTRLEAEEADRVAREAREAEELRLKLAIEEQERKEREERILKEQEEIARIEREKEAERLAKEAERVRLEMEERLKREEEERVERRKRVEAIMARTRKQEKEQKWVS